MKIALEKEFKTDVIVKFNKHEEVTNNQYFMSYLTKIKVISKYQTLINALSEIFMR